LLGIPNIDNSFVGKKVICLGDSITENNTHNDNKAWCEYLADIFGMFVYNNGKSGTGLVKGYQGFRPICNRVDLGSNDYPTITPDMVLIMANGNDATSGAFFDYNGNSTTVTNEHGGASLPVGSPSDSANTLSVYGAMKHLFNSLITKYPNAQIGFITSTPRLQNLADLWGSDKAHFYGHGAFDDYVTAIKWVCDEYNIPCLDLYHSTILRPWNSTNASTFYADSEIHPNTKGTIEGIVKPVIRWMMENFF
jgi:lysophospholipase L1-like esterase